ncbi:hypothetical protein TSOC_004487 [Tetrabaena socialis]|uniref:BRCT domain-containing protein n=1 Tax=Tetrabaena socialis TaxID=47790 RepID=A0A2J8A8R6_9CHLO|nr:hypothetical protein TSOC_004487 [Tetrabaena socialis]|eukprot:PNH08932.1 hypothetical protein TSOC_004487 [Tetrabaena socialis]
MRELVTRLGGTFAQNFSRRCSYLVMTDVESDKFAAALRWGVPVVNPDWVLDSAIAGRPLDDPTALAGYLPKGITPAEMEERRQAARAAAARRGGGGDGGSQLAGGGALGPTQQGPGGAGLPMPQIPSTMPIQPAPHDTTQPPQRNGGHSAALGMPPRPSQAAPRSGALAQEPQAGGPRGPQAARLPQGSGAPPAAGRPQPVLQPLLAALLDDGSPMGEARTNGLTDAPVPYRPAALQDQAAAPREQAAAHPGEVAGQQGGRHGAGEAGTTADQQGPGARGGADPPRPPCSSAQQHGASGGAQADPPAPQQAPAPPPPPPPAPAEGPPHDRQPHPHGRQPHPLDGSAPEDDAATAMLLQFINHNKLPMQDMMCSQIDLPLPLPMLPPAHAPLGAAASGEGPLTGPGAGTSEPSRQLGSAQLPATLSMKLTDADMAGAAAGGRRTRKRTAAAAAGEGPGLADRVAGPPGRRGRAEEEEGFGVAMSQQVGYEAVAAAPPPRATRSTSRSSRGGGGADAKESLINAVQGNKR